MSRLLVLGIALWAAVALRGQFFNLRGHDELTLSSGSYEVVRARDFSSLTIDGTLAVRFGVGAFESSMLHIRGGSFPSASIEHDATLFMTGGEIATYVAGFNTAELNFFGGSIAHHLTATQESVVNFHSGSVGLGVAAQDDAVFNLYGGTTTSGAAFDRATFHWWGGRINGSIYLADQAELNVYGTDFSVPTGADLMGLFEPYASDPRYLSLQVGFLLADGTPTNARLLIPVDPVRAFSGRINLVAIPEPAISGAICGALAVVLLLARRPAWAGGKLAAASPRAPGAAIRSGVAA